MSKAKIYIKKESWETSQCPVPLELSLLFIISGSVDCSMGTFFKDIQ